MSDEEEVYSEEEEEEEVVETYARSYVTPDVIIFLSCNAFIFLFLQKNVSFSPLQPKYVLSALYMVVSCICVS
nr:unnamed protein product [Callosobruchus chinensis]